MIELFRTKNEAWQKIQSNLLFIAAVELLIYNGGLKIKYIFQANFDFFTPIVGPDYGLYYNSNFWIIIPILLTLAFMWLTCPGALTVFTQGTLERKLRSLGIGLALGCLAILLLTFGAWISGTVTFNYNRFDWQVIPAILPLFIQCAAEEILLRGYVLTVVGSKHSWDVVCFISGTLFIFHHILNMEYYGFSTMFCLVVFLIGVLFCLLVWAEGNFWIACGIHTGWNYVQTYIFGVTNSGNPTTIGVYQGVLNRGSGFYHETYGYEGSVTAAVLITATIILLIYMMHKKNRQLGQNVHISVMGSDPNGR